jgi:DNA-directed RNA polymerase specialized sigma24 family protein
VANAADAETAFRETLARMSLRSRTAPRKGFEQWAEDIARQIAQEQRKATTATMFSDDLIRQLADSAGPSLDLAERRPAALAELLNQLPPPEKELLRRKYELGMTPEQIAQAEDRPVLSVAREMAALHESLINLLRQALREHDVPPPGGASDLGRLTDQLLDGTINEDGRLILETLLLADAAAQAHYHRHVALACELNWAYRGQPVIAVADLPKAQASPREWLVTAIFILALLAAAGFLGYVVYLRMR